MGNINLNNKRFTTFANSKNGKASADTVFYYQQKGNLVTADYEGGSIVYGKIIGKMKKDGKLEMLYQCLTTDNELKAGKAIAEIEKDNDGLIHLKLKWEWLDDAGQKGISEYIEIS